MYTAAIFDLDGVLINSEGIHLQSAKKTFHDAGFELSQSDFNLIVGRNKFDWLPDIIKIHNLDLPIDSLMEIEHKNFQELWNQIQILPHAKEVLHALKDKNILLSLATNSSKGYVDLFLTKFDLEGIFSNLTTGDEVKHRKPDPEIYNIAKSKISVPIDQIIAIEDSEPGVLSAASARLAVAAIPNEYTKDQNFTRAIYRLESLQNIISLF